jgi:predicted choloylglycine hydrolase
MFTANEKRWKELKDTDKNRNFFMMNRFLSIKYPVQVSLLSHFRINSAAVSDYWHSVLTKLYKTQPSWIFAKTKKKATEDKKKNLPSEAMIKWWCQKHEISRRDFDDSVNFFGDSFLDEVRDLEKVLKTQGLLKES